MINTVLLHKHFFFSFFPDGCPVPMIPNAKRVGGKSPPYKLGNFVKYKCEDGYTMNGEDYIVCRANGWSPEPPRCIGKTEMISCINAWLHSVWKDWQQ